jgi:hypothetical protein
MLSSESDVEVGFDEDDLDLFDDEEENSEISDGENINSGKRIRGKGLIWSDAICERSDSPLSFPSHDDIIKDAKTRNLSKRSSKGNRIHNYKCKVSGCPYLFKYCKAQDATYAAHFYSSHSHPTDDMDNSHRGLTESQKSLIVEAIGEKCLSARVVQQYFRKKRKLILPGVCFPSDPPTMKLNNFIQAYKKKNVFLYNPSPTNLVEWCSQHSPSSVDITNETTYNTPFVLGYKSVSISV